MQFSCQKGDDKITYRKLNISLGIIFYEVLFVPLRAPATESNLAFLLDTMIALEQFIREMEG